MQSIIYIYPYKITFRLELYKLYGSLYLGLSLVANIDFNVFSTIFPADEICKWRSRLKKKRYVLEKKKIRFGRGRHSVSDADDIFVNPELLEDHERPEHYAGDEDLQVSGARLKSYQALMAPCDRNNMPVFHKLIFGYAGTGKSTVLSRLAFEWAKTIGGENQHCGSDHKASDTMVPAFDLVLLLECRKFKNDQTLEEAIEAQLLRGILSTSISTMLSKLGRKCAIFVDGFDELPTDRTNSILDNPLLSECFVIVTTRPHVVDKFCLNHYDYLLIKIAGFSADSVDQYVTRFFAITKQSDLACTLKQQIVETSILTTLSKFPILLDMMCLLWQNKQHISFRSMTKLYREAITYLNKPFEDRPRPSAEFMYNIDTVLLFLGKYAMKALAKDNNLKIKRKEFVAEKSDGDGRNSIDPEKLLEDSFRIGITFEEEGDLLGDTSITFIHKTFQEYCAAVYLSHLFQTDRLEFDTTVTQLRKVADIEYILRFCCGLKKNTILSSLSHVINDGNTPTKKCWRLPLILLHESQLSHGDDAISLIKGQLSSCQRPLGKELQLNDAELSAALVSFACTYTESTWLNSVTHLDDMHGFDSVKTLLSVLQHIRSLTTLSIRIDKLEEKPDDPKDFQPLDLNIVDVSLFCDPSKSAVNVNFLTRFLLHFCSLQSLRLQDVCLEGTVNSHLPSLSESLNKVHFVYHEHIECNVNSLVSFIGSIPSLPSINLHGVNLIGEVDQNISSLDVSKVLKSCYIISGSMSRTTLVGFLKCYQGLETVSLNSVFLFGPLDSGCLLKALKTFHMSGVREESTNFMSLMDIFECMPFLECISLEDVTLIEELLVYAQDLTEKTSLMSRALKVLHICGKLKGCTVQALQLIHFLQVAQTLEKIKIENTHVLGGLPVHTNTVLLNNLKEFDVGGKSTITAVALARLLARVPSRAKVKLEVTCVTDFHETLLTYPSGRLQISQKGGTMDPKSVIGLIEYLLGKQSIKSNQTNHQDNSSWSLSEVVEDASREACFKQCHFSIGDVSSLLDCLQSSKTLKLLDVNLSGELDTSCANSGEKCYLEDASQSVKLSVQAQGLMKNIHTLNKAPKALHICGELTHCNVQASSLFHFLQMAHTLQKITIKNTHVLGELSVHTNAVLLKDLKEFHVGVGVNITVVTLARLLMCIPSHTEVKLQKVTCVTDFHETLLTYPSGRLQISQKEDTMDPKSVVGLIEYLTDKQTIKSNQTDHQDDSSWSLSEIVKDISKETCFKQCHFSVGDVISLFDCLQSSETLKLVDVNLSGELDTSCANSCETSFLENENIQNLSKGPKVIYLSGEISNYIVQASSLFSFLKKTPFLEKIIIRNVIVVGEHLIKNDLLLKDLKECTMIGKATKPCKIHVATLVQFLILLPPKTEVNLNNVTCVTEFCEASFNYHMSDKMSDLQVSQRIDSSVDSNILLGNLVEILSHEQPTRGLKIGQPRESSWSLAKSVKQVLLKNCCISLGSLIRLLMCIPQLKKLKLFEVDLSDEIGAHISQLLPVLHHNMVVCRNITLKGILALAQSFQHTPTLQHLDLSDNSISSYGVSALAQSFQHIPTLQHLNLYRNSIGSDGASVLAQSFQHTPVLQHLDLSLNNIDSNGASALAQSFQHTPALQHLNLYCNSIGPDGASVLAQLLQHTPALQHLNLSWNDIGSNGASALAQSFQHTPALQHLNLSRNIIGSDGASALAQSFQHTPALQHLDLQDNSICSDGASALAQSFQHTPALQHLNLQDNSIGSDGASALAQSFQHTPALQHLNLSRNIIGSDGASALAQSFQHTPALQHLDLQDNSICSDGASALAQSFQHTPALQHLNLQDNSIGSDGASALAQSFQHTPALQHLDLHGNSIGSDGASTLAQSFQHTPALQHLDLQDNSICSDGASALAQSFQHTPALQHLNLQGNSIGLGGASALAQSFQHTPALQHLDLHGNSIGSDGASALAQSFQHTPALQHLNLQGNSIGSDGASALAQSFQHTPALQHLDLHGNSIGSDGASALAQSFQHTPALQHLDLHGNSICSDGASALAQSFQHTPALQHLNLQGNRIGSDGASTLARSFQHTPALQHLDLHGNTIDSDGASALAQSFQHTPALQHLDLGWNNIGSVGASTLARSFQHTPALQHLNLYLNSIGSYGASALAQSFQHTPALQHLDLQDNSICSDGASALAQSFQHTPALQHLNLQGNSIGLGGASALAQSFQHTPALQHLDLHGNSIGSDGASTLARSFQHTPALQHLNLYYNFIGSDGASVLAQSFQHTPVLQHLDLSLNHIDSNGASALALSFQHTPALQHLDLSLNDIGPDGASALAQSFQHTPALQHLDLLGNSIGSDGASTLARSFQHTPALQHLDGAW